MASQSDNEQRPEISTITTAAELKRWYWLKEELTAQAKVVGVKVTGAKFDVLERLAHFLETGEKIWPEDERKRATSKFDWHGAPLSAATVITDNYKNTQNVRRFFQKEATPAFKFNIAFMEWMTANVGKTLGNAVLAYNTLQGAASKPGFKTKIKPHNQYNQYMRDFLADNPNLGTTEAKKIWALKRALPSDNGRHVYEPTDLKLTKI